MLICEIRRKLLSAKTKEDEGSVRALPVAAPTLKSEFYREREEGMFRLPNISTQFCLPSTVGVAMFL